MLILNKIQEFEVSRLLRLVDRLELVDDGRSSDPVEGGDAVGWLMLEKSDPSLTFDARDHESKVILLMLSWNNSVSVNIDRRRL